jgi:flagellar hook-length control protein FliK
LLRNESSADAEAPQPFALNPSTSSTASTLGLARTSVVNPMDAPSADLHGDDFADTIGSRLTWMAEQKIGHAHIRINPAELGPVEIRMRLDGERVHADFSSGHAEVRQALESSLPKLREMLATQGFALGQTDVGHHGQSRSSGSQQTSSESLDGIRSTAELEAVGTTATRVSVRGLLDAYA